MYQVHKKDRQLPYKTNRRRRKMRIKILKLMKILPPQETTTMKKKMYNRTLPNLN